MEPASGSRVIWTALEKRDAVAADLAMESHLGTVCNPMTVEGTRLDIKITEMDAIA